MPRVVRVTDYGTHGWFISVCDKCGAEVGMSAKLYTRNDAETARCFICEPVPVRKVTFVPDPDDVIDFCGGDDLALAAVNGSYAQDLADRDALAVKEAADRARRYR